jgi:hypothetical protein
MLFVITKKIIAPALNKVILDFKLLEFLVLCLDILIFKDAGIEEIF